MADGAAATVQHTSHRPARIVCRAFLCPSSTCSAGGAVAWRGHVQLPQTRVQTRFDRTRAIARFLRKMAADLFVVKRKLSDALESRETEYWGIMKSWYRGKVCPYLRLKYQLKLGG